MTNSTSFTTRERNFCGSLLRVRRAKTCSQGIQSKRHSLHRVDSSKLAVTNCSLVAAAIERGGSSNCRELALAATPASNPSWRGPKQTQSPKQPVQNIAHFCLQSHTQTHWHIHFTQWAFPLHERVTKEKDQLYKCNLCHYVHLFSATAGDNLTASIPKGNTVSIESCLFHSSSRWQLSGATAVLCLVHFGWRGMHKKNC